MHSTGIGLEKSYPLLFLGFGAQGGVESEINRKVAVKVRAVGAHCSWSRRTQWKEGKLFSTLPFNSPKVKKVFGFITGILISFLSESRLFFQEWPGTQVGGSPWPALGHIWATKWNIVLMLQARDACLLEPCWRGKMADGFPRI